MTFAIRRHTEQLHRKATKCVPAFTLRNEPYPEHYEAAYAKAMRNRVAMEATSRNPGRLSEQRMSKELRKQRVLSIMADGRDRTLSDVCNKMGVKCVSERENIRNSLIALQDEGALSKVRVNLGGKKSRIHVWSLAYEPHVSCKDRIAAAKAEASA